MGQPVTKTQEDLGARDRVLKAAVDLFAENGYAATSIREIVTKAGVTKPVLYYYFGSKDRLFQTIADIAAQEQENALRKAITNTGTAFERLSVLFNTAATNVRENHSVVRLFHALIFGPENGAPPVNLTGFRERWLACIREICMDGIERKEMKVVDLEAATRLINALIHNIVLETILSPEDTPEDLWRRMLHLAYSGLGRGES